MQGLRFPHPFMMNVFSKSRQVGIKAAQVSTRVEMNECKIGCESSLSDMLICTDKMKYHHCRATINISIVPSYVIPSHHYTTISRSSIIQYFIYTGYHIRCRVAFPLQRFPNLSYFFLMHDMCWTTHSLGHITYGLDRYESERGWYRGMGDAITLTLVRPNPERLHMTCVGRGFKTCVYFVLVNS